MRGGEEPSRSWSGGPSNRWSSRSRDSLPCAPAVGAASSRINLTQQAFYNQVEAIVLEQSSRELDQISSLKPIAAGDRGKYRLVVEAIEELCAKLGPGGRLPPQRTMAAELNVTISTLTRAVSDLTRRGLLTTRRGAGTTVAQAAEQAKESVVDGLIDFRFNVPPIEPVADILREALASLQGNTDVFQAEPLGGSPAARQAGVEWLRIRGINPVLEQVFLTDGTHEAPRALRMVHNPWRQGALQALHYSGVRQIANFSASNS
ncbi:GntR family transcriptional regulator (plasmid) [Sinorhizobium meliloti]|nr:GntR family transcriptional regulator [Sinorhizobium meliloti]